MLLLLLLTALGLCNAEICAPADCSSGSCDYCDGFGAPADFCSGVPGCEAGYRESDVTLYWSGSELLDTSAWRIIETADASGSVERFSCSSTRSSQRDAEVQCGDAGACNGDEDYCSRWSCNTSSEIYCTGIRIGYLASREGVLRAATRTSGTVAFNAPNGSVPESVEEATPDFDASVTGNTVYVTIHGDCKDCTLRASHEGKQASINLSGAGTYHGAMSLDGLGPLYTGTVGLALHSPGKQATHRSLSVEMPVSFVNVTLEDYCTIFFACSSVGYNSSTLWMYRGIIIGLVAVVVVVIMVLAGVRKGLLILLQIVMLPFTVMWYIARAIRRCAGKRQKGAKVHNEDKAECRDLDQLAEMEEGRDEFREGLCRQGVETCDPEHAKEVVLLKGKKTGIRFGEKSSKTLKGALHAAAMAVLMGKVSSCDQAIIDSGMLGNGVCNNVANVDACEFDLGDCCRPTSNYSMCTPVPNAYTSCCLDWHFDWYADMKVVKLQLAGMGTDLAAISNQQETMQDAVDFVNATAMGSQSSVEELSILVQANADAMWATGTELEEQLVRIEGVEGSIEGMNDLMENSTATLATLEAVLSGHQQYLSNVALYAEGNAEKIENNTVAITMVELQVEGNSDLMGVHTGLLQDLSEGLDSVDAAAQAAREEAETALAIHNASADASIAEMAAELDDLIHAVATSSSYLQGNVTTLQSLVMQRPTYADMGASQLVQDQEIEAVKSDLNSIAMTVPILQAQVDDWARRMLDESEPSQFSCDLSYSMAGEVSDDSVALSDATSWMSGPGSELCLELEGEDYLMVVVEHENTLVNAAYLDQYYTYQFGVDTVADDLCYLSDVCSDGATCQGAAFGNVDPKDKTVFCTQSETDAEWPGKSTMSRVTGGPTCGCFMLEDKCLYSRFYYLPHDGFDPWVVRKLADPKYRTDISVQVTNTEGLVEQCNGTLADAELTICGITFTRLTKPDDGMAFPHSHVVCNVANGTCYAGSASEVNMMQDGIVGDVQCGSPTAECFQSSGSIDGSSYIMEYTCEGGYDAYGFRSGLSNAFDGNGYEKMPIESGTMFWEATSTGVVHHMQTSNLFEIGMVFNKAYKITEDVSFAVPESCGSGDLTVSGCFDCASGFVVTLSLRSSGSSGIVYLRSDSDDLGTSSLEITTECMDYEVRMYASDSKATGTLTVYKSTAGFENSVDFSYGGGLTVANDFVVTSEVDVHTDSTPEDTIGDLLDMDTDSTFSWMVIGGCVAVGLVVIGGAVAVACYCKRARDTTKIA